MEYDREFTKLSRFARSLVATEKDKVERFVNGLKISLQKDLALCELPSYAEALDRALKAKWIREQMNSDKKFRDKKQTQQESCQEDKKEEWLNKRNRKNGKCERCGRDHEIRDCPQLTGACFRSGEKGHLIANCPQMTSQGSSQDKQKNWNGVLNQPPMTQGRL